MDKLIKIAVSTVFLLLFIQIIQCQMKKNLPEFGVEISAPDNKYRITPIFDKIKTLEDVPAGLPYGSSSGSWGDSGSTWTPQHGTPVGADITYYSRYEDIYYRLNVDFPVDTIKDYMERAYARLDDLNGETHEYKRLGRGHESSSGKSYDSFSTLVFGFAPKGMVVVWLNFGITRIELGRYQANVITDSAVIEKTKKKYLASYRISSERYDEAAKEYFLSDASPKKWDNYRNRYHWRPVVHAENPKLELIQIQMNYYNGEAETMLRPWVSDSYYKERAVPSEINVVWLTSKNEADKKQAFIYLNWEKANEAFKNAGNKIDLQIKISKTNTIEILLNGHPFEAESIRVFDWSPSMIHGMMYKNVK
ncbi:hypothetical protein GCM10022423_05150 [Flavobacterium ginsengiterrae]|uniref:DUF2931 family protein n=2 Tax=Flavobacterium ginsengiterrae TaxID=871695 RepID=A0ABP7G7H2_9FLAO